MYAIRVDVAPFTRQYNLEGLVNPHLHGRMCLVLACPLNHPTIYPNMAIFSSSDKALILDLLQELDDINLYNV